MGVPRTCGKALSGATEVARRGFVVDQTFVDQTTANAARFAAFRSSADLFLRRGAPPAVGSVFRNRDLADTYDLLARHGVDALYTGRLAREIVRTVQKPPVRRRSPLVVRPGLLELSDLASYQAPLRAPTLVSYRGLDVYGMAPPSSGGSTVGEALNILEAVPADRSTRPRRCTATSRRARWRSPTATGTSATRRSSTCPWSSCSRTGSRPSAPA